MKATELRKNIYSVLDEVIASGKTIEIERKGKVVKLVADNASDKFSRIKRRKKSIVKGDSGELANIHWDKEWKNEFI